jgi:hypothetical protein
MKRRGRIRFRAPRLRALRLDLTTHVPDLGPHASAHDTRPLVLELDLNGRSLSAFSLFRYGWLTLLTEVPEELAGAGDFELEIRADRTWRPRPKDPHNRDDRELSIAVCNIEAFV